MRAQPGSAHVQFVKCGKANCRCARGERHRAHYRFWRDERGRQRKAYVRASEVVATRGACEAWKAGNRAVLATVKGPAGASVRREIRAMIRSALEGAPPEAIRRAVRRV